MSTSSPPFNLPTIVRVSKTSAPPVPRPLQQAAQQTVAKYIEMAQKVFGKPLPMPKLAFDLRGKTAGRAWLQKDVVQLNSVLYLENEQGFHDDTIPHEVAHLVAHWLYGRGISAHGKEWQDVMRALGKQPTRCHTYDTSNSAVTKKKVWVCGCPGRTFPLGPQRNAQARRGLLSCKRCKQTLREDGSVAATPAVPRPPVVPAPVQRPGFVPPRPLVTGGVTPAPVRTGGRAPTEAMLNFARLLAKQHGIALQLRQMNDFDACSQFIETYKRMTRLGVTAPGGAPPAGAPPSADAPTAAQLDFARAISNRRGVPIPPATLSSRRLLSDWITANR